MIEKKFFASLVFASLFMFAAGLLISGCVQQSSEEYCAKNGTNAELSLSEAKEIAQKSECAVAGRLKNVSICNNYTGTWWIDIEPFTSKEGCNPACVVSVENKTAEVNWRCTGLIPE